MRIIDVQMKMPKITTVYSQACATVANDIEKPYLHFSPFTLILFMGNYLVSSIQVESYASGFLGIYFYLQLCVCVCVCVFVRVRICAHMHEGAHEKQKREPDPLVVRQEVVRHLMKLLGPKLSPL